jgi:hypothetical protein
MDGVMMVTEELRHLLVELGKVVFDHAQFFQCELHQSPIHRVEIGARATGIAQLVGRRSQARVRQRRQRGGIPFAVR